MTAGRPRLPDGQARTHTRSVHLSDTEDALVEEAARLAGLPVTRWMREKAVAAAKRAPLRATAKL